MALTKGKPAAKAEEDATKKQTPDADSPDAPTPTPKVELDENGNAINPGDANSPGPLQAQPVTPQAIENDATDKQAAQHAQAAAEAEAESKAARGKKSKVQDRVKAKNLTSVAQRQPSSGTWVAPGESEELIDDGWLQNQIAAGLFEEA